MNAKLMFDWIPRDNFSVQFWSKMQNNVIPENEFEIVVRKMLAVLSRPKYVNKGHIYGEFVETHANNFYSMVRAA